jgi:type I restriction enzyme S subunit
MKLAVFFEKFHLLADAPDAVAKMRELVLDLAATGRLLPHKDEWVTRSLKSLATKIGSGATPSGGRESYFSEGVPLIRSMNVHFRGFDRTGLVFLSEEQADELSNVIVQKDDVLLNITGASIGRVTVAPTEMAGARVNQHVTIVRPTSELFPRFLSMFLASPSVQRMIDEIQVGATRQALTKAMIEQFDIPLPPFAEQKRIVAKVDELMTLCDRLEAQHKERETRHAALARASLVRFADGPSSANLSFLFHPAYSLAPAELRGAIQRQVFLGHLRWEPRGSTSDQSHVSRLQAAHREAWKSGQLAAFQEKRAIPQTDVWMERYVSPEFPDRAGLPRIPPGWAWIPLELACPVIIDSPHRTPVYSVEGEYPALRPRDVAGGTLKLNQVARVQESEYERQTERRKPRSGDIVYSRELSFGWAVILPEKPLMCLSQGMVSMQAGGEVDANFLCKLLNSPIVRDQAAAVAIGAAHPHVNLKDIRRFSLPFPPLPEQLKIMDRLERLMALVDELETKLAASRATSANLLSAVVAELTQCA